MNEEIQFTIFGYPVEVTDTDDNGIFFEVSYPNEVTVLHHTDIKEDEPCYSFLKARRGAVADTPEKPISGRYFINQATFDKYESLFTVSRSRGSMNQPTYTKKLAIEVPLTAATKRDEAKGVSRLTLSSKINGHTVSAVVQLEIAKADENFEAEYLELEERLTGLIAMQIQSPYQCDYEEILTKLSPEEAESRLKAEAEIKAQAEKELRAL